MLGGWYRKVLEQSDRLLEVLPVVSQLEQDFEKGEGAGFSQDIAGMDKIGTVLETLKTYDTILPELMGEVKKKFYTVSIAVFVGVLKPSAVTGIDDLKRVPPLLKSLGGFLGFGVELNQMQLQCQARLAQHTGTANQKAFVDACGTFEGDSLEKLGDKMTAGESVIAEVTALEAACANITFSRKDPQYASDSGIARSGIIGMLSLAGTFEDHADSDSIVNAVRNLTSYVFRGCSDQDTVELTAAVEMFQHSNRLSSLLSTATTCIGNGSSTAAKTKALEDVEQTRRQLADEARKAAVVDKAGLVAFPTDSPFQNRIKQQLETALQLVTTNVAHIIKAHTDAILAVTATASPIATGKNKEQCYDDKKDQCTSLKAYISLADNTIKRVAAAEYAQTSASLKSALSAYKEVVGKFSASIDSVREKPEVVDSVNALVQQVDSKVHLCDLVQCFLEQSTVGEVAAKRAATVYLTRLTKCGIIRTDLPAVVQAALDDLALYLPLEVR